MPEPQERTQATVNLLHGGKTPHEGAWLCVDEDLFYPAGFTVASFGAIEVLIRAMVADGWFNESGDVRLIRYENNVVVSEAFFK